jgi:hypothetical protein
LKAALELACEDAEVRGSKFVSQFLTQIAVPAWAPATPGTTVGQSNFVAPPPAPVGNGRRYEPYAGGYDSNGKGYSGGSYYNGAPQQKGKGKGSYWKGKQQLKVKLGKPTGKTSDNRRICFTFNKGAGECDGGCNMLHICRLQGCFLKHPMTECTTFKKDTQIQ